MLKDKRVDPSAGGNAAIQMAAMNGHVKVVERLLLDERVDPSDGSAIYYAEINKQLKIIEILLKDPRVIKSLSRRDLKKYNNMINAE